MFDLLRVSGIRNFGKLIQQNGQLGSDYLTLFYQLILPELLFFG
jgi:hypothetical protein